MRIFLSILLIVVVVNPQLLWGQESDKPKFKNLMTDPNAKPRGGVLIDISYGGHLPYADLAENFKYNFSLSGKLQYLFPSNLMVGLVGDYYFSEDIKTDVVANLREPGGSIIDKFGTYSDANLGQRGFFVGATVGYLIPVIKNTKRSGIEVRFSGGYLQHWVRIQVLGSQVFALEDAYKKGYDRMTSGFGMSQYIGYRHLDKGGLLNFFGGFDIMEAFTKNRRGFNYDTGQKDTRDRLDIMIGLRIGLTIPFYVYSIDTDHEIRYY